MFICLWDAYHSINEYLKEVGFKETDTDKDGWFFVNEKLGISIFAVDFFHVSSQDGKDVYSKHFETSLKESIEIFSENVSVQHILIGVRLLINKRLIEKTLSNEALDKSDTFYQKSFEDGSKITLHPGFKLNFYPSDVVNSRHCKFECLYDCFLVLSYELKNLNDEDSTYYEEEDWVNKIAKRLKEY